MFFSDTTKEDLGDVRDLGSDPASVEVNGNPSIDIT